MPVKAPSHVNFRERPCKGWGWLVCSAAPWHPRRSPSSWLAPEFLCGLAPWYGPCPPHPSTDTWQAPVMCCMSALGLPRLPPGAVLGKLRPSGEGASLRPHWESVAGLCLQVGWPDPEPRSLSPVTVSALVEPREEAPGPSQLTQALVRTGCLLGHLPWKRDPWCFVRELLEAG